MTTKIEWPQEHLTDEQYEDLLDELADDEYDGQPDEAQEWADFDPDC